MKTPKEKSKELINKFTLLTTGGDDLAKQSALICVEEVLNLSLLVKQPNIEKANKIKPNNNQFEYWKKVKSEIEKL